MNLEIDFSVVIPARYDSTRFPGKVLVDIKGKPMVQHVVERALEAGAKRIIVATDSQKVADTLKPYSSINNYEIVLTSKAHESGTERIAEVVQLKNMGDQNIVVNVQGDEPFVPSENIRQVAWLLAQSNEKMSTLCTKLDARDEIVNPNSVKVVRDAKKKALYFSRATIPFERAALLNDITDPANADMSYLRRHIGIYAYTVGYIKQYVDYDASPLEKIESLEQLRALWYGDGIIVDDAVKPPPVGIDTPEDLTRLLQTI